MDLEPPAITFIPYEEHFRPVLPTIEGNVDYLALRGQLTTMRSLKHWIKTLIQSKIEQIELSGEGRCGVIELQELVHGRQQERFQEHSIRALRCRGLSSNGAKCGAPNFAPNPECNKIRSRVGERALGEDLMNVYFGL